MCDSQIAHRHDHTSFSVLGLSLLIGVGLIIILVNLSLVLVVHHLQPATALNSMRQNEWDKTETLELQQQLFFFKKFKVYWKKAHNLY